MYKHLSLFMAISLAMAGSIFAQASLSGTVSDARTGDSIPGVNVYLVEAERGGATNVDGIYTINNIPEGNYTIRITYIGYQQISENINIQSGSNTYDVELEIESYMLSDIVVSALGIRRTERSIGYASQQVSGQDLSAAREPNIVDALAGRTAGVSINSSSGQPGAGSRIVIRGNTSLQGNNQPLFVVDGVPISNDSDNTLGLVGVSSSILFSGGSSNRGLDIDPDNIESMSVLKGASATALYGSRAANGAIIITTRSGEIDQAPTINFSSSVSWADAYTDGYQLDYLGGTREFYYNSLPLDRGGYVEPGAPGTNPQTTSSWGPHKNEVSQQVLDDLGVDRIETFNPRKSFYETGVTLNNSISLAGGTAGSSYYFSVGNTTQGGIVPGTSLDRTSLMARFSAGLSERINVESSINYTNTNNQWLAEGNGAHVYLFGLNNTPVSFDIRQPVWEDESQRMYSTSFNNPFWLADNNGFDSDLNRFIANTSVQFEILPWLSVSERIGIDTYTDKRKGKTNLGTRGAPNGNMYDQKINRTEINSDLIIAANRSLTEDFTLDLIVGNNINIRDYNSEQMLGTGLNIPGFFHISNANVVTADEDISQRRLIGLYSQATIDYMDIVYLTLTARNDWSSTLPQENNSYFYPSASLGFVFTDAFDLFRDTFFSFGKLRLSISQIGNDAPVYSTATTFIQAAPGDGVRGVINYPFSGVNGYRLQSSIGNPELRPEISTEYEVGLDLRFFEGRARADISYYDRSTVDQIFRVPTSSATGFSSRLANAGEIRNYGIELSLGGTPIQTENFQWSMDLNFAKNTTDVIEFAPGVENIFMGGFTDPQIRIEDSKNGYGVIWSNYYERNEDGQLLIGDNGLPLVAPELGPIGYVEPDWTANLRTRFSYRGWSLSALLDKRQGGDILNMDLFYSTFYGTSAVTGDRGSSYVFEGVNANTGEPNTTEIIRDQDFYQIHYSDVFENFVEDGSFLKLREISISYTLPQSIVGRTPFQSLTITGTGRNLWIDSDFSYRDPEGSLLGTGNAQGFYHMVTPATRNYSLSLNVSF